MFREATRAITSRERAAPKTVLGFFAVVLSILMVGGVGALAVLARYDELRYLIPIIVVGEAAIFLLLLLSILGIVIFGDPTRLMLGRVTGTEYTEYQRLVLGDNVRGARPTLPDGTSIPELESQRELAPGEDR